MLITEVRESMLPLWLVECKMNSGEWRVFTMEPFDTKQEAEDHLPKIAETYPQFDRDRFRVAEYTAAHWRHDLTKAIIKDEDAMRRVLGVLHSDQLALCLAESMSAPYQEKRESP